MGEPLHRAKKNPISGCNDCGRPTIHYSNVSQAVEDYYQKGLGLAPPPADLIQHRHKLLVYALGLRLEVECVGFRVGVQDLGLNVEC